MQINTDDLRRYYASLSDEALLELDRDSLTEVAQRCYDDELAQRKLSSADAESSATSHVAVTLDQADGGGEIQDIDTGSKPDWLGDAACACSFESFPGDTSASDAENASEVLLSAGIPCHIATKKIDDSRYEYSVMVPGALNLAAASVLDKEIFNPKVEADWKVHLEMLSNEDLRALNSETICAGLVDRVNRLRRVYDEEIARRKL